MCVEFERAQWPILLLSYVAFLNSTTSPIDRRARGYLSGTALILVGVVAENGACYSCYLADQGYRWIAPGYHGWTCSERARREQPHQDDDGRHKEHD